MSRVKRWAILCFLTIAVLVLACANKQDVLVTKLRGQATGHDYPVTIDQAWNISKTIFRLEPTDAIEEYRKDGYMLTSQDVGGLSSGTYLGAFIERADRAGETRVTFIARRKSPTQAYPALTEAAFHRKFAELVSLINAIGTPASTSDAGPPSDAAAVTEASATSD
jgi:hypothetical protein